MVKQWRRPGENGGRNGLASSFANEPQEQAAADVNFHVQKQHKKLLEAQKLGFVVSLK